MADHWDEYDVSIEHPGMQQAKRIERGATTIDAGNILFSPEDKKRMKQLIAMNYNEEPDGNGGKLIDDKDYRLEKKKRISLSGLSESSDDDDLSSPLQKIQRTSASSVTPLRRKQSVRVTKKQIELDVENFPGGEKAVNDIIEKLETFFGDNFDEFWYARLMDGIENYTKSLSKPEKYRKEKPKYLRKPDNPHRHAKQVDVAADIFGALGGAVMEKEKDYEKIREESVEKMRNNKVYQFCMLLSGFTNERMDKYWITPSEKGSIPMIRTDDRPVENFTNVEITDIQKMGSGYTNDDRFNVYFGAAKKTMWLTREDLEYLAGKKFPRNVTGKNPLKPGYKLDVDINKLLDDRRKVPGVSMQRPRVQDFGRVNERAERGMDQSLNMYPEIGGAFHNWYVSTSWADGKLHLSPMVYAHLEEAHSMLQLKWKHLSNVPLYVFVESDQMRTYFARLVAFNMRISDVLSGKRYHSNATYPRINNERARLLNVFRHVNVNGDELQYYRQEGSGGFVRGAEYTERYLDNLATVQHRRSSTPWQNNMDEFERMSNLTKNLLSKFT